MPVPVIQNWTEATNSSQVNSLTLTKPSGVVVGELLKLIVGGDMTEAGAVFNAVSGWTKWNEWGNGTSDAHLAVYYRIADGTEPSTVAVTHSGAATEMFGWYLRISGADTSTPFDGPGTVLIQSTGTSAVIPGFSTSVDNVLAFYGLSFDGGDGFPFSVSGTGWAEVDEAQAGTGGAQASGCFGTKSMPTAGATGDATVTCTVSDGKVGIQWGIKPAVADARSDVSWAELEIPAADRNAQISWAEFEVPTLDSRADISWAEFEVPSADRDAEVSWAEFEVPDAPPTDARSDVSWAELEIPAADRDAEISWAEFEVPSADRDAEVSWAEFEVPTPDSRADISWAEFELPAIARADISWAEFEVPAIARAQYWKRRSHHWRSKRTE